LQILSQLLNGFASNKSLLLNDSAGGYFFSYLPGWLSYVIDTDLKRIKVEYNFVDYFVVCQLFSIGLSRGLLKEHPFIAEVKVKRSLTIKSQRGKSSVCLGLVRKW
jgi:hypothetical protein